MTCCRRATTRVGGASGHATRLLALAAELLAGRPGIGWERSRADRRRPRSRGRSRVCAWGSPPRAGLAQSLSAELVGVSSLQALAQGAGCDATLAVIDARRGEVFAAAYIADEQGANRELMPARALAPADLRGLLARPGRLTGEHGAVWRAVGDGAVRYRGDLQAAGAVVAPDADSVHQVSAVAICEIGARARAAQPRERVVPDYCRRPDAELALERSAATQAERARALEAAER